MDFKLASSDDEQIAITGVAKEVDPEAKVSALSQQMESSVNAIKILRGKVRFLIDMVKNCPEIRSNQNFMRRLN